MTLQKAMRIRSELKKEAASLQSLLDSTEYPVQFKGTEPSAQDVQAKQNEALPSLDGLTYAQAVQKLFAISDACLTLNTAIEAVNRRGHELLFREAAVKSKLQVVDNLLGKERCIKPVALVQETDYDHQDSRGSYARVERTVYTYPHLTAAALGQSLTALKKQLTQELSAVRDELAEYNATRSVEFTLPDGLL